MKKLNLWIATAALLFALNPTQLKAEKIEVVSIDPAITELEIITPTETNNALLSLPNAEMAMVSSAEATEAANANAQLDRLNEINEMDMSAMNASEKRELRKEVRAIEKQQKGDGVYISVGAAILIVLLLILLL